METLRSPARVLVVDNQKQCRMEIDGMLERQEYATVLSGGRDEAIAHIERDAPYDLVLSDLSGSGSDGNSLMGRMRRAPPDTPLVLLSHDLKAALAAVRQGAYDYLLKPVEKY